MPRPLALGDSLRCPHCRQWHVVTQPYATGTTYTQAMLMFSWREQRYYAGQVGTPSRHPSRPAPHTQ